jgi:hypothetical protein
MNNINAQCYTSFASLLGLHLDTVFSRGTLVRLLGRVSSLDDTV